MCLFRYLLLLYLVTAPFDTVMSNEIVTKDCSPVITGNAENISIQIQCFTNIKEKEQKLTASLYNALLRLRYYQTEVLLPAADEVIQRSSRYRDEYRMDVDRFRYYRYNNERFIRPLTSDEMVWASFTQAVLESRSILKATAEALTNYDSTLVLEYSDLFESLHINLGTRASIIQTYSLLDRPRNGDEAEVFRKLVERHRDVVKRLINQIESFKKIVDQRMKNQK
jgi:hypothetical protein